MSSRIIRDSSSLSTSRSTFMKNKNISGRKIEGKDEEKKLKKKESKKEKESKVKKEKKEEKKEEKEKRSSKIIRDSKFPTLEENRNMEEKLEKPKREKKELDGEYDPDYLWNHKESFLKRMLPFLTDEQLAKFQIDKDGIHYLTDSRTANKISYIIYTILNGGPKIYDENGDSMTKKKIDGGISGGDELSIEKKFSILDGTAGIGGNLIGFEKAFAEIYGTEIDSVRFKMLENNVKILGLRAKVENEDFNKFIRGKHFDAIFLDPIWGPNYKEVDKLDLFVGDISLENVVDNILKNNIASVIAIKGPYNTNTENLSNVVQKNNFDLYKCKEKKYVIFMIAKNLDKLLPKVTLKFSEKLV